MPATFTPIDREALAALKQGDERILERIFRERFTGLMEEAQRDLGADAASSAPKVVETAILHAWGDRASFETPDALDSFLRSATHDGALRERKRRATLHRIDAREGVKRTHAAAAGSATSVDDGWEHIKAALHAPAHDAKAAARASADAMRHETAGHIAKLAPKSSWRIPVLSAIAFIIVAGGAFWWLETTTAKSVVDNQLQSPDVRDIKTVPGQMGNLTLDDGSTVKLGPASRLRLVPKFGDPLRGISLEGTGSFTVSSGQLEPFELRAKGVAMTVKGTVFDVRAFPEDTMVTVRVKEGQVDIKAGKTTRTLTAGSAVLISRDFTMSDAPPAALDEALGWIDSKLVITNRPLRAVLPELKRWYGIDLYVPDSTLLGRPITMTAGLSSSKDAITAVAKASELEFGYEGQNMVLKPAKGKKVK